MANIDKIKDYVFAAVVSRIVSETGNLNQGFLTPENSLEQIRNLIDDSVPEEVWTLIFDQLNGYEIYQTIQDDVVGNFYKLLPEPAVQIVHAAHSDPSSLVYKYRAIGPEFLSRALAKLGVEEAAGTEKLPISANSIPASDRTVNLNHNEMSEFDERTSELIDSVEKLNQIDDVPGFRELLIGQLKAGRELIRAGSFKLYVIQVTLIDTLKFLAARYEKEAVGALAAALLSALLQHFGMAA